MATPVTPRSCLQYEDEETRLLSLLRRRYEFLDLPREVRNIIYCHLFASTRLAFGRRYLQRRKWRWIKPAPNSLAILRTCRQVYQETGDIWISQITFSFEHPDSMFEKLYSLPSSLLSQIRHLRIHLAYLDIDATPEAQKPLNNHCPYDVIEYELPSVFQLLSDLRLETLTLLGWEFEFMENMYKIIPFMLVIKRDDKDHLLQYDPHSIRHLVEDRLWDQLRVPPRHVWPEEHAEEEEIDSYRYLDDITWAPKDFDAPMKDEWDMG